MENNNHSRDEKIQLINSAVSFASYVTEKYPQVAPDGRLNYYISGSLGVILLSMTEFMDSLDASKLPQVLIKDTKILNRDLKNKLQNYVRKIGDFDYVETEAYKEAKSKIPSYFTDPQGYSRERKKYLFKGGGGPSFDELSELEKAIFESAKPTNKVMCDPVITHGMGKVIRIGIHRRDFFISDPFQMFGYKVLHLLQAFDKKPDKLKRDFSILHIALSEAYTENELVESVYNVLAGFEQSMSQYGPEIKTYLAKTEKIPDYDLTIRPFIDKLKHFDLMNKRFMQSGD